jgi:hypothetical protein
MTVRTDIFQNSAKIDAPVETGSTHGYIIEAMYLAFERNTDDDQVGDAGTELRRELPTTVRRGLNECLPFL